MYFQRSFFALQRSLVPICERLAEKDRQASYEFIATFIQKKPKHIQIKLFFFLLCIDLLAFLSGARSFTGLPSHKQKKLLSKLFDSNIPLLRKGFWGLNTLAKMSVYGQSSIYPLIGYHPKIVPNEK